MSFFNKLLIFFLFLFLTNCGGFKQTDGRTNPINAQERAKKNVEEGKGTSINRMLGRARGGTNYEFSTSNPMWRASLEILDFLPMSTVDYSGGVIISDWYTGENNIDESIKVTIRFLSNEVRSDSLKIIVHKKTCASNGACKVFLMNNSKISQELLVTIVRKAAILEKDSKEKKKK
tara:strand:+ start:74 stop:601 length:528 start_codon:yes stop_codon:yes gene_type:complete